MATVRLKLRRHELSRTEKYPDMVDIISEDAKGKQFLWATVHIDTFDGLDAHNLLNKRDQVVEIFISDESPKAESDT
jgi:hypothetical protein